MSKENKLIIGSIVAVVIMAIGFTYAYFAAIIEGNRKNITINMTDLRIIFNGGDTIEGSNLYSEDNFDVVKTFTIENKTKSGYEYNLVIEDLVNTTATNDSLVYKITCDDSNGYNMDDFKELPKSPVASNVTLAFNIGINKKSIQTYTIEIKYINKTDVDQSADMGAILSGKLYISKGTPMPTLAEAMLRDNPTISERTDFSVVNTENTTGTLFKTNKTEDGSDVYYYSGNTTNNWVKFGKFYWRIIRSNEDGSVRVLYSGTSPDTTQGYIGTSVYNSSYNDPMYVGYMYGTSGSLANNRTNTNDSTIKTTIDTWYKENLLTVYDKYISKTAIYCNDRSVGTGTYSTGSTFYYGARTRLSNYTPTYKCGGDGTDGLFESTQATADKFSASTEGGGNGQLKYPVAMMTSDELSFAGGKKFTNLISPYAWYYTNSQGKAITGSVMWLSLSPNDWDGSHAQVWFVYGSGNPGFLYDNGVNFFIGVRPVVSLASCVGIKSGDGTPSYPYVIDESSCS